MKVLACLDDDEKKSFIHLVKNQQTKNITPGQEADIRAIKASCSDEFEKKLAQLSEKENYAAKNHYLLQKRVMRYGDKKRMAIDEKKVRDLLRHQHDFRAQIEDQIPNQE